MQRFEDFQRIEHAAHAHVVRHAAVDEMEVRPMDAVAISLLGFERAYCSCGGSRRVVGVEEWPRPCGYGRVAGTAIILDRDGREHHRHGRRGRGSAGQRHGIEVRADNVERALVEDEAGAGRDVGGGHQDQRALAAAEIAEGATAEEDFVVQLGR